MAIQVLPIIKALAPVIATAGSMYAEWQRGRQPDREVGDEKPRQDLDERVYALEKAAAENSHLIAQLAEQLRQTALQLDQTAQALEAAQRRWQRLAVAAVLVAAVALVTAWGLAG